ncbi:hypothetical protein BDF21DRAFT_323469, partial [Thamnidium elegans]
ISFPWYLTLFNFLSNGSLPLDVTKDFARRIRYRAKLMVLSEDGRVLEKKT